MGNVISKILDEEREYPPLFKPVNKESVIKWQTGEPKTHGRYLVQTKEDGFQIAFWSAYVQSWSLYNNSEIIAWCKLSDIEPYKV